jgi:hypothetical protein
MLCVWLIGLLGLVIYHPHVSVAARGPLLALPQRSPSLARSHHSCAGFLPSSRPAAVSRSQPLAWSRSRRRPAGACSRSRPSWGDQQGYRQCHDQYQRDHHLVVLSSCRRMLAAALALALEVVPSGPKPYIA